MAVLALLPWFQRLWWHWHVACVPSATMLLLAAPCLISLALTAFARAAAAHGQQRFEQALQAAWGKSQHALRRFDPHRGKAQHVLRRFDPHRGMCRQVVSEWCDPHCNKWDKWDKWMLGRPLRAPKYATHMVTSQASLPGDMRSNSASKPKLARPGPGPASKACRNHSP